MCTLRKLSLGLLFLAVCPALSLAADEARLTGRWKGEYSYPDGSGQDPVKFQMVMIQDGTTVVGFIKEPNSFGKRGQPWLFALIKGSFEKDGGKLTLTKTYDGTAGAGHDVEYSGALSEDGNKIEGNWTLSGAGGGFTVEKVASTRSGPFSGVWSGEYQYAQNSGRDPVKFDMIIIYDGQNLTGFIKEPNTIGDKDEPRLHAAFKGRFDKQTRKLTFTKTYDGTAGVDHDVEYSGQASQDGAKIEGTWTIDNESGRFTLEKLRLDEQTLDSLK